MENQKLRMLNIEDCIIMAFDRSNGEGLEVTATKPINVEYMIHTVYDAIKKYDLSYELEKRNGSYIYTNKEGKKVLLYPLEQKERDMTDKCVINADQGLLSFIKQSINDQNQCKEVKEK